jgi:urea transporter
MAHLIGLDYGSIRSGLYGYNGCLTAMAIAHFSFGLNSWHMIGAIVLMSACSTIFFVAMSKIFVIRLGLSPFTSSFQICSFLWLLGALKFRYFFVDGNLLTPGLLTTIVERSNMSNLTVAQYSVVDIFAGFFTSVSEVYFIGNVLAGVIILLGVFICSPILSTLALFGAITGQLTAAYLFGLPAEDIRMGLWGYNSLLTCQALGGMFFVLSGCRIWLFTLFGSVLTVVAQAAISSFFAPMGMPPLMLPSTLICWMFCLMAGSTKNMIAVKLRSISIPEDHLRRFRLTSLVKMHFEFVNNLSTILEKVGRYEDIPLEDLTKIEAEFVPILLCSYAHQNDVRNLKALLYEGADVNSTDYDLRSPLHLAACSGNTKLCRMLIANFRAYVNPVDEFGGTPLYDAFCHGHFHLIPFLYSRGARMPLCKTKELTFYLCALSFEGNLEAVQYLIACGVNPNLTDYDGRTALHLAVCGNHYPVVKYLVEESNASLSITDYYGQTPIDDALRLPDKRIAFYLHHFRDYSSKQKPRELNILVKNVLNDNGNDDLDDDDDEDENDEKIVDNSPASVEESLLPALFCMAAAEGSVQQMVKILEQFPKFRADSVDYDFRSAAHVAAAEGQLLSIQFLCEHSNLKKQDLHWINREDRWGFTPIEEAYRYGHYGVANYLKERQMKNPKSISLEINQKRLPAATTVGASLSKWMKVLHFGTLASKNEAELIDGLLASGVFSSSELYADYDGRTPMHLAAVNGHLDAVKVLQFYGDDGKTHRDRWGNCALDEAKQKKFVRIVDVLFDDIV